MRQRTYHTKLIRSCKSASDTCAQPEAKARMCKGSTASCAGPRNARKPVVSQNASQSYLRNRERLPKICCHLDYAKGKPIGDEVVAVCRNERCTGKHVIGTSVGYVSTSVGYVSACSHLCTPILSVSCLWYSLPNGNDGFHEFTHARMHPYGSPCLLRQA